MTRYRVIYSKSQPAFVWCDTIEQAKEKAKMYESVGYDVTIWEYDKNGARPYGKTLLECFGL